MRSGASATARSAANRARLRPLGGRSPKCVEVGRGTSELPPRLPESGVFSHRLLVVAYRALEAGRLDGGGSLAGLFPLEECVVGGEVLRGLLRKALLFARPAGHAQPRRLRG